jgi:hypothetical protein
LSGAGHRVQAARWLALISLAEHSEMPGIDVATLYFGEDKVLGKLEVA